MLTLKSFLFTVILISLRLRESEAIYCYECNSNWVACSCPLDFSQIQYNQVPCTGSCYTSWINGVLYRGCTTGTTIEAFGGQTGTITNGGNTYNLCTGNLCDTDCGTGSATTAAAASTTTTLSPTLSTTTQPNQALYCYECNSNWAACACPPDLATIYYNKVPCTGSCYTSMINGILYRGCTTGQTVQAYGGQTGTIVSGGNSYNLCTTYLCNTDCGAGIVTTANPCTITGCLNGGTLNAATCTCSCLAAYSGIDCSIVSCTQDDPSCPGNDCTIALVYQLCPFMCGNPACSGATTASSAVTTAKSCTITGCLNGGTFNAATCTCSCLAAYSGIDCSIVSCTQDDPSCPGNDCTVSFVYQLCPFMCGNPACSAATTASAVVTTASALTCYACDSNTYPACTGALGTGALSAVSIPCTTSCYSYWSNGVLYRGCLDNSASIKTISGGTTNGQVVGPDGTIYNLCTTALCNGGMITTAAATTAAVTTAPCTITGCLNGGTFNSATCTCSCLPAYSGIDCSIVDCTKDDPSCVGNDCTITLVYQFCPFMCGNPACAATTAAGGSTVPVTTAALTTDTTVPITSDTTAAITTDTTAAVTTDTTVPLTTDTTVPVTTAAITTDTTAPLTTVPVTTDTTAPITTAPVTTAAPTTAPVTTACPAVPCTANQGFVNASCLCQCYPSFTGTMCEITANCVNNALCATYQLTATDCLSSMTLSLCPGTCSATCTGSTVAAAYRKFKVYLPTLEIEPTYD